ncbi:hypothetical protein EDC14_102770 [Hydrogenispora ethanolica]|jgi:hypothetical protein|uniref:Uncharacterized protein n=1 Tax=Hydrogenispora ethanolica TaxID=1082276 RepID=A0A4R1R9F9_HYDET|nr:hypothetical protein [Hydrogenispora ethanolica]TCL62219.1 hypothetical protein EDC14_102770 [Hydrogenispora ethanolica]
MENIGWFLRYLLWVGVGMLLQYGLRWPSWLVMIGSFATLLLLPPWWSLSLVCGCWIGCAFFTVRPESSHPSENGSTFTWFQVVTGSVWAFSGFMLTLLLLWRVKTTNTLTPAELEILGWSFLLLVEVCIYKNIASQCPMHYRKYLSVGMTALIFLMLFYAVAATNFITKFLTFVIILNGNLFLLTWVDHPLFQPRDPLLRRRR